MGNTKSTTSVSSLPYPNCFLAYRRWCFTPNNPEGIITELDFEALEAKYMVFQLEQGDETHTVHYQGYIEFPCTRRMAWIKKVLPTAHLEVAKGTSDQCEEYCTKEDTRLEEPIRYGSRAKAPGKRTDILALRDAIKSGKRGRDLFDDDLTAGPAIRYSRGVADMGRAYSNASERPGVRVIFHYGPAGTGKTHCAHAPGSYYFDGNSGEFWVGYQGQDTVVLDEFGGHVLKPLFLQRLCDRYPLWLPIKGSEMPCNVCFSTRSRESLLFANAILDFYHPYLLQLSTFRMVEPAYQV